MSDESIWIEDARQIVAQCWCEPETSDRVMDVALAKAVATKIALWMDTAAQNQKNADYYRGLLVKCGEIIGKRAYTSDDGTVQDDVLCAKIPELVEKAFSLYGKRSNRITNRAPVSG